MQREKYNSCDGYKKHKKLKPSIYNLPYETLWNLFIIYQTNIEQCSKRNFNVIFLKPTSACSSNNNHSSCQWSHGKVDFSLSVLQLANSQFVIVKSPDWGTSFYTNIIYITNKHYAAILSTNKVRFHLQNVSKTLLLTFDNGLSYMGDVLSWKRIRHISFIYISIAFSWS